MKKILIQSQKYGDKEILVDDEDFDFLTQWKWHITKDKQTFYARRNVWRKVNGAKICSPISMHRLLLGLSDPSIKGDHKDHNGLNNQKSNLRACTNSQNLANSKPHRDGTSKYLGVNLDSNGKWVAQITKNYKKIMIGRFTSENEAAIAYNIKAAELHGEFANLNTL